MISICIPVYNYDIAELLASLNQEIASKNLQAKIILIDDCSRLQIKQINKQKAEKHQYIELEKNIGRAKIRNLFLKYTQTDYMLFLDCDVSIVSSNFVSDYIALVTKEKPSVICGGLTYQQNRPSKELLLRWKYGLGKEVRTAKERMKQPHQSFMTSNFLIQRTVFDAIRFNEEISEYGHEDTYFGYELKQRNFNIKHINNPILHKGLETNKVYLKKTEQSILSLIQITRFLGKNSEFFKEVTLLRIYKKIGFMRGFVKAFFTIFQPLVRKILTKGMVSLKLFDFYKLGFLAKNYK